VRKSGNGTIPAADPGRIRPWTNRIGAIIRARKEPGFPLFSWRPAWFSRKPAGFHTNQVVFTPENDGKMQISSSGGTLMGLFCGQNGSEKNRGFPEARTNGHLSSGRMRQAHSWGVRQSGAVSGSVHSPGRIFSVVFGEISVTTFWRSRKRDRFAFHRLKQARKPASLFLFGWRKSGPDGLSDLGPGGKGSGRGV